MIPDRKSLVEQLGRRAIAIGGRVIEYGRASSAYLAWDAIFAKLKISEKRGNRKIA
jgi:hypothetical protein